MPITKLRFLTLLCACLLLLSQGLAIGGQAPPAAGDIKLIAHRGFHVHAPENSLAALQAAIDLGIAGSEVDLRTSKDGHVVLMHDATLDRTTNGQGQVERYKLQDLKKLFLKDKNNRTTRHRIATFEEALKLIKKHPQFELALDLKQVDPAQAARLVVKHDVASQVIFAIPNPQEVAMVRAIQKIDPRLKISANILGWWKIEGLPSFCVKALGVQALFASEWFFPRYGFAEAREAGAEVIVFLWGERDLIKRMHRAISLGAQVISSDRPDVLIQEIRRMNQAQKQKVLP